MRTNETIGPKLGLVHSWSTTVICDLSYCQDRHLGQDKRAWSSCRQTRNLISLALCSGCMPQTVKIYKSKVMFSFRNNYKIIKISCMWIWNLKIIKARYSWSIVNCIYLKYTKGFCFHDIFAGVKNDCMHACMIYNSSHQVMFLLLFAWLIVCMHACC